MAISATRGPDGQLRAFDAQIDQMVRNRDLRVREVVADTLLPERRHERFDQYYLGVRIVGGDVTRQVAADGTVSVFGVIHPGVDIDVAPRLSVADARAAIGRAIGGEAIGDDPELAILPLSDGYHLAYAGRGFADIEVFSVFVDANTGALLRQDSEYVKEVGKGKGVYGDDKKVSVKSISGAFVTDDQLRPSAITTYDMKGNVARTTNVLNGVTALATSDIATDSDNDWTDAPVVDGHVYAGWYYDYLFKRFGRHGLDGRDLRMVVLTHPVSLGDISSASPSTIGTFYLNAFFCATCGPNGRGAITLGEGAPRGFLGPNIEVKPFAAALDVVAHELTHGVTSNSSRLGGTAEAGALNEGFSDIFGASAAFFYQTPGSTPLHASYLVGKDLSVPSGAVLTRSLNDPAQTGNPDHYSRRGIEVHFNSTILSHAFYLAVEGGTNRTSGASVQGVGANNRDQIEKVFFRALTQLLPSAANFGLARAAVIQAARDLYGSGGRVETAVTQAFDAVGVQERTVPTAAATSTPLPVGICSGPQPSWGLDVILSAGVSSLTITQWQLDSFDATGKALNPIKQTATDFARLFSACGPGSARVQAQADVCAAICFNLGGAASGAVQLSFTANDDANRPQTFSTPRVALTR
jgi:bacillolysin